MDTDYAASLDLEAKTTRSTSAKLGITVERAEGSRLITSAGEVIHDLTGALGAVLLGYSDTAVVNACSAQLADFMHVPWQCGSTAKARLLEELRQLFPADTRFLFGVSGADGIEAAMKISRTSTGAHGVLAFSGGFHGKSAGTLEVTASDRLRRGLLPVRQTLLRLPYPCDVSAGPEKAEESIARSLDVLQSLLQANSGIQHEVGAVLVEGVQGASMTAPAVSFLQGLRQVTRENNLLLILDEVYSGAGRTGRFFSYQYAGIEPDLVVLGKALGAGLPLSIVAGRAALVDTLGPALQSSTFSGNALACAAATAVLSRVQSEAFRLDAERVRHSIAAGIDVAASANTTTRWRLTGAGLMIGLQLDANAQDGFYSSLQQELRRQGFLVLAGADCLRLTPPACLADADIERFTHALTSSAA